MTELDTLRQVHIDAEYALAQLRRVALASNGPAMTDTINRACDALERILNASDVDPGDPDMHDIMKDVG